MKFTLLKPIHTTVIEETEVDLLETNKFISRWNNTDVIGIYIEQYEWRNGQKGIIYNCYWGRENYLEYLSIPDYDLKRIAENIVNNRRADIKNIKEQILFDIIVNKVAYDELTEEEFVKRYNNFKEKVTLPIKSP